MADGSERRRDPEMRELVERVADRAAERSVKKFGPEVVKETLANFGVDTHDKATVQRQMLYLRDAAEKANDPDFQKDMAFVRANRERCDKFYSSILSNVGRLLVTIISVLLLGGLVAWWSGILKVGVQ